MKQSVILLVEDNADTRAALDLLLRDATFRVEMAGNGAQALHLYRARRAEDAPYDLLVLDAALPDFSGFAVAEEIRADGDQQTPIIFCTAYDEPIAHARAHLVQAHDVWFKPDAMTDFKELLTNALTHLAPASNVAVPKMPHPVHEKRCP